MSSGKQLLRRQIRQYKQSLSPEEIAEKSTFLCARVMQTPEFQAAKTIYGYLPFNQEVNTLPLLEAALALGKQVALPKCYGREMRFILTRDLSQIQASAFGAPEPLADSPVARDENALVIVPGLVFDRQGYRIGYGGGFYDRFLAAEPNHPTIALCYDFQLVDRLLPEPHDLPVHTVFSH